MKVMHEGRLAGVSVASNPQEGVGGREREREREREAPTRVLQTPSLVMDLKGSLNRK